MPSWKKVILSGSDAALNTLSVSNSITASVISASQFTGSLFGTSSWAIRAVSSSYLSGSTAIVNNLTVNNNLIWDSTPNTIAGFASSSGNLGPTPIEWYIDNTLSGRPVSLRVGVTNPASSGPYSGSHILKDGRELFTNAKAAEPNEPFIILGFGGKNDITLDTGVDYQHVGIDDYDNFIAGEVYAGSLKIRKTLYGITEADTGQTKLYTDGFVIPPASPGFVLGDGGFYMFESNSMQFNPSGALLSPVASASVKFTIAPDSSSLSISVGKNDLREMLFISRSGNSPRIGVGKSSSGAALDVNGSVIVTGSLGMSGDLTTQQISASSTVRLSGAILELPNLSVGTTGNYNNLLIVDSTGRVRTLPTGSVPYIEVGSGVVPTNQALVMFTGSTGDIANAIGITYSSVLGWSFSNAGTIYDAVIPNLFTSNLLATNVTSSIISASGGITGSDLRITGFPSVSASLASLASGVGTLQQVTDAGNTTTNAISSSFPGVGFFGTASWAINVVNGGGGGGGGSDSAFLNQSTAATTWSFTHNLGTQYPVITVYDTSGQVIIPQEIDGEDTNNLKIYFPTSQSGYATAVGGTSALTYYSQSLTTASVNLNTITFTKGDSSTFPIVVNTFPHTGSAIISGSLIVTGSTAITGGFEALGAKGSKIQLGTYNVGYDIFGFDTTYITGAGLIVSGNMPDQNHHNFLKIGNIEMVDVNTALTSNEFLIHNVNTLRITSGADGGNITTGNQLLKIGGGEFYVYRAGSGDSAGIIQSTANSTTIRDTILTLFGQSGSYFYIPNTNEITTLNGTDYLMGFATDPSFPASALTNKIKADKFIWATGSNQIISGGLTITGSLRTNFLTASGLNYPSADSGEFSFIQTDGNGNLSLQYVNTLYETVYNGEATQLVKGTPVYISGANGANSIAYRADAGSSSKMPVIYVTADAIDPADTGRAIALGLITGVNTTGYPGGTEIYVGVGGGWTSTRPTGSAIVQVLGYVTKEGAGGQGVILNPGPANLPNLPSGSVWLGNSGSVPIVVSSASLFVNSASFALTASFVKNAQTASYILNAISSSFASTASYVLNAVSSSFSSTASFTPNAITTASVNLNTITFTKGSGTTFNITVDTGSGGGGGSVTINNNVDNYIITATGTANTLNGEANLTFDGTTLTVAGNAVINAIDVRNDPSTTIGQYAQGAHIARDWPAAGGPALTAGNIVYFSGSSQWTNAQANATGSSTRVLGVVTDNADPNEIVLQGTITINTDLATYQVGQPVYLSPISGGKVTNVPPSSSGHIARYVGWVVDTSGDQIYFNPDFTYIQL